MSFGRSPEGEKYLRESIYFNDGKFGKHLDKRLRTSKHKETSLLVETRRATRFGEKKKTTLPWED